MLSHAAGLQADTSSLRTCPACKMGDLLPMFCWTGKECVVCPFVSSGVQYVEMISAALQVSSSSSGAMLSA